MRQALFAFAFAAAALAVAATATAQPREPARTAASAQHYGVQAVYRGAPFDIGYSARTRRVAECLVTYPGAYDPKSDLVRVAPGVTRRCTL